MTGLQRHEFDSAADLASALADDIAAKLDDCIRTKGRASMALSGGTTPKLFLSTLGQVDIDWRNVSITLVDERWVPPLHPRSNARMLQETLFAGKASGAEFIPLYQEGAGAEQALNAVSARVRDRFPLPPDVVVLGMGNDGHTASLFPHTPLEAGPGNLLAVTHPDGMPEARMTMTLHTILSAPQVYLHLEGERKLNVLEKALKGTDTADMPIRAVLHQMQTPVVIFSTL